MIAKVSKCYLVTFEDGYSVQIWAYRKAEVKKLVKYRRAIDNIEIIDTCNPQREE